MISLCEKCFRDNSKVDLGGWKLENHFEKVIGTLESMYYCRLCYVDTEVIFIIKVYTHRSHDPNTHELILNNLRTISRRRNSINNILE